jgi:hypothetical protein
MRVSLMLLVQQALFPIGISFAGNRLANACSADRMLYSIDLRKSFVLSIVGTAT